MLKRLRDIETLSSRLSSVDEQDHLFKCGRGPQWHTTNTASGYQNRLKISLWYKLWGLCTCSPHKGLGPGIIPVRLEGPPLALPRREDQARQRIRRKLAHESVEQKPTLV